MPVLSFLPQTESLDLAELKLEEQPGRTYKLDMEKACVRGMTDEADAVLQAVYLILNVERYQYPIYSHNYGVELADLIGQPADYVMSEIKRRITEALTQDDRITAVDTWSVECREQTVTAAFTVHTVYGDIQTETEVTI